jgi:hypothetical protein
MTLKLIARGNYNEVKYDQTLWYTLTDLGLEAWKIPSWENPQMEMGGSPNRNGENPKPIPINTNILTNKSPYVERAKKEQDKKPDWNVEKKCPLADVTKQSTSYNPNGPIRQSEPSLLLKQHLEEKKANDTKKAAELLARAEIQSNIPVRDEPGVQGAAINASGYEGGSSGFRSLDGLLEASGTCARFEETGLADTERRYRLEMGFGREQEAVHEPILSTG